MDMKRTYKLTNRQVYKYVSRKLLFTTNNQTLFSRFIDDRYVVFSYGDWWALYVHVNGIWYENTASVSSTTSRHRTHANPKVPTIKLEHVQAQILAEYGLDALIKYRMTGEEPRIAKYHGGHD